MSRKKIDPLVLCSVVGYCFAFFMFGLQVNLLGPTATVLAHKLGVVEPDLGVIFTINGLTSIIGAMPSGSLIDKLPGHAVLAAALAFEALGYLVIPFTTTFAALATAFGCVALSWNIVNTAGNTFILWIGNAQAEDNPQGTAFLINIVNALFGAGSLAAPLLAELCATGLSNAMAAYWITGALTGVAAALFLLLPSPSPPASTATSSSSCGPVEQEAQQQEQQQQQQQQTLSPADAEGVADGGASSILPGADAKQAADWRIGGPLSLLLLVISLFNFLNVGTEVAFGGWIFTYSIKQVGLSTQEGHFLNASYWAAFTLGRVVASFAAVYLTPATLLFSSLPLAIVGAAVALAAPPAWVGGWLLLVVSVLVGLGASAGFANALAILDGFEPCTGGMTGLLGGVAGAGCMTMPLVVAVLAKHTVLGYQGLMLCSLVSFGLQLACVPVALLVGGWLVSSRERDEEWQSITKEVVPDEQQPLLESEC